VEAHPGITHHTLYPRYQHALGWKYNGWGALPIALTMSSQKLLCRWGALPIAFAHVNQKIALKMESTPYVARPLTKFQHLASFFPIDESMVQN
jgi:hypothetical protein